MSLEEAVKKRRTFAIISHPDAGKTTLTEKLLLYSGLLRTAGMVRGGKGRKVATSDWMSMEQERGISITASAMQFPYKDVLLNVLDTPGHQDFSEDTYRTLTAADSAVMVIDAAKGVEKQTRKLFEVCRLRGIPVLTLINKMDMPGRDPLDLMQEVEEVLQIHSTPLNWPIGSGREFQGVVDLRAKEALFFTKISTGGAQKAEITRVPWNGETPDPELALRCSKEQLKTLNDELELLTLAGNPFSEEAFLKGEISPVFFASALTNFGLEPFFDTFVSIAPCPHTRPAKNKKEEPILIDPVKTPFSAYVFKIQANMDKRHRDSMAFLRVCSGHFERDLMVHHERLNKQVRLARSHGMVAGERTTLDDAYPGDVIGVINPGLFIIGDSVSSDGGITFPPLPQFQPEVFARLQPSDVGRRKSFDKGVLQLIEEGTIQRLMPFDTFAEPIFAAVGQLQFDVLQYRLRDEYQVDTHLTPLPYTCSAWLIGDVATFQKTSNSILVYDRLKRPLVLFTGQWEKEYALQHNPNHRFCDIMS